MQGFPGGVVRLLRRASAANPACPLLNGQPRPGTFPAGAVLERQEKSAKGPVSRILSCAVIPLDAALPRTFISDLPGGSGNCLSRLGASGRCAAPPGSLADASLPIWSCSVWGLPCPRRYRRGGALLPHHFTLTPALEFPQRRAYPASRPTRVLRFQGGPPERGVAEAVSFLWHWPSTGLEARVPDVIRHTALRSSDFPPPVGSPARSHRQRPPGPPARVSLPQFRFH